MKVNKLIEELKKLPHDMEVLTLRSTIPGEETYLYVDYLQQDIVTFGDGESIEAIII